MRASLQMLTRFARALPADARADLADRLAQSDPAGAPASERALRRFPSLIGAYVLGLLAFLIAIALGVDDLVRVYTCASRVATAQRASGVAFGVALLSVAVLLSRREVWIAGEALRLGRADRARLAEALRETRPPSRHFGGLSMAHWVVSVGAVMGIVAIPAAQYLVHRHGCAGGADAAWRQLVFTAACSPFILGYLVWSLRRTVRAEAEAEARLREARPAGQVVS